VVYVRFVSAGVQRTEVATELLPSSERRKCHGSSVALARSVPVTSVEQVRFAIARGRSLACQGRPRSSGTEEATTIARLPGN
jgi:hypothetical protein